jgi:3-hydroxyisobutyrate dehydrogenase/2-hydroxy-3-oxopropionate reductase
MTDTIGLVGVGAMGSALLKRLVLAGRAVQAYDILEDRTAEAAKAGAVAAATPAAAAEGAACTHVFVRTDDEVSDAVLGADGVLQGAVEGALVLLHSTIMPDTTKRVAAAAEARGVTVIDAPVTAVPRFVAAGEAVFLLGGDDEGGRSSRRWARGCGISGPLAPVMSPRLPRILSTAPNGWCWPRP